jgi:hypothetical protein
MIMSKTTKTDSLKGQLLFAMERTLGNVSQACKIVNCHRSTYYDYYNIDGKFAKLCDETSEIALDFAESMLMENIKNAKETSIIFYLKTKGKKRGYIEKQELDLTRPVNIIIDGDDARA